MKIENLCYLKEIARCKSISAAAKRLYIGQTTLSAIIKSLEEELNVQIFRRTPSGVVPTEDGQQILELSTDIIDRYNEMLHRFQISDVPEKRVHFLGDSTMCRYFSVQLTKVLQQANEQASIVFHEVERRKLLSMMVDGVANIGVTSMDIDAEVESFHSVAKKNEIEITMIGVDKFYLVVRADHYKYAQRESVDINELTQERYVAPKHYSAVPNGTAFSEAFRKLSCVATLPSPELVQEAVAKCNMIAILSGRTLVNDLYILSGILVAIPLTGFSVPNKTGIYLFSKKRESLSYFEKIVYDTVKEYCEQTSKNPGQEDGDAELYLPISGFN